MSKNTITEGDPAEIKPADAVPVEKDPEEKNAPTQEQTEEQETVNTTIETVEESPQLPIKEVSRETPTAEETVQKAVSTDQTPQVLVESAVSETVQEQVKFTEIVEDQVQPSDHESIQKAVSEEKKLTDVPSQDIPDVQKEKHVEQPVVLPDEKQKASKLEVTVSFTQPLQTSEGSVTVGKEDAKGIPEEVPPGAEIAIGTEARRSMIPGIDELVQPAAPSTPVKEETEIEHITSMDTNTSHVSLHVVELPEIRGLAELEYLERKESIAVSIIQEDWMDDDFLPSSRRKSTRPSLALRKLMEEEDDEPTEKTKAARPSKGDFEGAFGRFSFAEAMEDKQPLLSREEYYAVYEKLMAELPTIKMKNKFLQRKMGELFKKRKVEHALKEELDIQPDVIEKYKNQLDKLSHLLKAYRSITVKINNELDSLQKEKDIKDNERQYIFNKFINREKEIGFGLISTKTGKEIPNKVVEQLIRRQLNATHETSVLRLKYITKREELAEKTAELKSLDNIGEDLSLMDYEQLKIENRSLADKLEEKEEELSKLRLKCRNAVQVMAHVREKAAALDADMDVLKEDFEEVNYEYIEMRERLNFCKTERDEVRNKTMKLKAESGLLTKPKLLLDMETSMEEAKLLEGTLEKVKNEYNSKTQQIRTLRKNIAYEMMLNRKPPKKKKKPGPRFYNARPTLVLPKIPTNVIERLEKMMKKPIKGERSSTKRS